jgi:hypothetical protein
MHAHAIARTRTRTRTHTNAHVYAYTNTLGAEDAKEVAWKDEDGLWLPKF